MKIRLLHIALIGTISLVLTGCQAPTTETPAASSSKPVVAEAPSPTVAVDWFWTDEESVFRFLATISNSSDKAIEGLETEWVAYDSNDAIIGSKKGTRPTIPAGGVLTYVGGAGSFNLSGVPARVEVRIINPGRFTSDAGPLIAVSDVKFEKDEFGPEYTVTAKASAPVELTTEYLGACIVLKNAAGDVVGADFWAPENLPSTIPAGSSFAVEAGFITVDEKPASAEVVVFVEPAS